MNRYLIDQVISLEISEMRPLFVICQMCPNTFGLTKMRVRSSNCGDLLVFASTTSHPDYRTLWSISPHLRIDDGRRHRMGRSSDGPASRAPRAFRTASEPWIPEPLPHPTSSQKWPSSRVFWFSFSGFPLELGRAVQLLGRHSSAARSSAAAKQQFPRRRKRYTP